MTRKHPSEAMSGGPPSPWYLDATPGSECGNDGIMDRGNDGGGDRGIRCEACGPDGFCEACDTFEGRACEAICEYASTCDGCGELVAHDLQRIPPESDDQLGYCEDCRPDLFADETEMEMEETT